MDVISRQRWTHIIPAALAMYTIGFMDRVNIGFAAPGMAKSFNASTAEIGAAMGIFFLGYIILPIPGGYIAEHWSTKKWITILLIGWSTAGIFNGLAQNLNQMFVARFFLGLFEGGVWPAVVVLIGDWFPRQERATANSLWEIALPIAAMVTAPISGLLIPLVGWRGMLILESIPPLIWAIVWWRMIEDKPEKASWLSKAELYYIVEKIKEEKKNFNPVPFRIAWRAMIHPNTLLLSLAYFFSIVGSYGLQLWAPSIIKSLGVGYASAGFLLAIPNFFAIWAMIGAARLSDRLQKRKIVVSGVLLISSVGFVLMGIVGTSIIWLTILFMTIATAGFFARQGPLWVIPHQTLPPGAVGLALSVINLLGNLGGIVGSWLMGYVKGVTNSFMAGYYTLAGALLLSSILILFVNETKRIELGPKDNILGKSSSST
ncbi:MAG: MFS transporter [Desulfitobacteriaceae bacterium]